VSGRAVIATLAALPAALLATGCATGGTEAVSKATPAHECPHFAGHPRNDLELLAEIEKLRSELGLRRLEHDHDLCRAAYCYGEFLDRRQRYDWKTGRDAEKTRKWLALHGIRFSEAAETGGYLPTDLSAEALLGLFRNGSLLTEGDWRRIGLARHT